ncbi:MAG: hypothetical protein M5U12_03250 [Verrucomicrobia bacterium]|nr:hypothetical protein [Verrucomicrobiota bacterium]
MYRVAATGTGRADRRCAAILTDWGQVHPSLESPLRPAHVRLTAQCRLAHAAVDPALPTGFSGGTVRV